MLIITSCVPTVLLNYSKIIVRLSVKYSKTTENSVINERYCMRRIITCHVTNKHIRPVMTDRNTSRFAS